MKKFLNSLAYFLHPASLSRKSLPILLICISLILLQNKQLSAQTDKKALQGKYEKLQDEIKDTEALLQETKKKKQNSLNEAKLAKRKVDVREEMIKTIAEQKALLEKEMQQAQNKIGDLQTELEKLKEEYARMIYYAYVNESDYQPIHFILAAKSINDAIHEIEYIRSYTSYRKQQLNAIESMQGDIQEKIALLAADKNQKETLLDKEQEQKAILLKEKNEKDKALKNIQGKEKELAAQIEKKKKDAKEINKKIQSIIADEIKKEKEKAEAEAKKKKEAEEKALAEKKAAEKKASDTKPVAEKKTEPTAEKKTTPAKPDPNLTPEAQLASKNFEGNKGKLPWPVERGTITERFGTHEHPALPGVMVENNGIDIATTEGAAVRAVFEGEVVNVVFNPSFQKGVIIKHGNYYTVYTQMATVNVEAGDKITTKQKIGTVYTDPEEGQSEVHLEIWKGTALLDPAGWISK